MDGLSVRSSVVSHLTISSAKKKEGIYLQESSILSDARRGTLVSLIGFFDFTYVVTTVLDIPFVELEGCANKSIKPVGGETVT